MREVTINPELKISVEDFMNQKKWLEQQSIVHDKENAPEGLLNLMDEMQNAMEREGVICYSTVEVTEYCSECGTEVTLKNWDIVRDGLAAYCPFCGERLMLCNHCPLRAQGICDYSTRTDTCTFTGKKKQMKD